jgi:CDP-glucose 4,6-dehydratase
MTQPFGDFYRGKTVLVTGHTGFKGSWLATWLTHLGARVVGYALEPPTDPSNFGASRLAERITHVPGDVRDLDRLVATFERHRPEIVLHLAAQALVRRSYHEPRETFEVNLMGTVNVLEAARRTESARAVVSVTSDKCYRNVEWVWGYREGDELGGEDPYSGSKACAELAVAVYRSAPFQRATRGGRDLPIASARAGNVIGGGDWAADRIVPDLVRAIVSGRDLVTRHPRATRPWQHVLEPLSGYLWLASQLPGRPELRTAWNFGPAEGPPCTVEDVVGIMLRRWAPASTRLVVEPDPTLHESTLLRLDCSKARHHLGWRTAWDVERTLEAIVAWYREFYEASEGDMYRFSIGQIDEYTASAREARIRWAAPGD